MMVTLNEKYDLTLEWFEEQAKRDSVDAWQERLCELLTIYRTHDEEGAKAIAEKLKALGVSSEKVEAAID